MTCHALKISEPTWGTAGFVAYCVFYLPPGDGGVLEGGGAKWRLVAKCILRSLTKNIIHTGVVILEACIRALIETGG